MKTFMTFQQLFETSKCSIKRGAYLVLNSREFKKPKNVTNIPDAHTLWAKYLYIKMAETTFKRLLLNQLVNESQVNKSIQTSQLYEKILIMKSSIGGLMKCNAVSSVSTVINGLLAQLEPFPFDSSQIMKKGQTEWDLSVMHIRNVVEKQYLAWKYEVLVDDIDEILQRYKLCLYEYRSMGNMKKNIDSLEKLPRNSKLSVAKKIYLINQKPFNINSVRNFQDTIAGLNWQLFAQYCPKILQNSHQYILFLISTLRDLNFTEKQIQYALPFLHLSFAYFLQRLNYMFSNPEIAKHREENKFLQLISFPRNVLQDMVNLRKATFTELTELISISSKNLTPSIALGNPKSILYHINQFYAIDNDSLKSLKKHPKYKLVSEKQIQDTLIFLKSENFAAKEIAESITILLYPRNVIKKMLEKIHSEAESLGKYGFKNGCIPIKTNFFKNGTKEKRKVLQLALYYLEKPYNFSGDGIWNYEVDSVADKMNCLH